MTTGTRVVIGSGVFVASVLYRVPHLLHGAWGEALLGFAALVVVPLTMDLLIDPEDDAASARLLNLTQRFQFAAAVCLAVAYVLPAGIPAALIAAPWAGVLCLLALAGGRRLVKRGARPVARLCRDVGLVYAAVGAAWLMCDRLGFRPLGFDPSIVLLTAVHFHYAGLLLPVLTTFALTAVPPSRSVSLVAVGIIAGVPAVAIGITATQLHLSPPIEVAATLLMALSGFALAMFYVRLALQSRWPRGARLCWLVAGLALGAGMALAALYGLRYFFRPLPWLDVPWMRAMHGSLNALGFGFFGVLGWNALARQKNVSLQRVSGKNR